MPHLANADIGVTYHAIDAEFSTTRSSVPFSQLMRAGLVDQIAFKVFLNRSGTKIFGLGMSAQTFCAAGLPVPGSHPEQETALAQAFVNGYDAHDLAATLALLSSTVQYDDCTPTRLAGKPSVADLLQQQFASGGRLYDVRIVTTSWISQPPNNPLTVRVLGNRTLSAAGGQPVTRPVVFAIVPTPDVSQIAGLSNSSCLSATSVAAR